MKYFLLLLFLVGCSNMPEGEPKYTYEDKFHISKITSKRMLQDHKFYQCEDEGEVIGFGIHYPKAFSSKTWHYNVEFVCKRENRTYLIWDE